MQVATHEFHSAALLGDLIAVEVHTKGFLVNDHWFCDKISVKIPKGDETVFPCYRWIGRETILSLRPASGTVCIYSMYICKVVIEWKSIFTLALLN